MGPSRSHSPSRTWRSEWQTPAATIRTRTSPARGAARPSVSIRSGAAGRSRTAARIGSREALSSLTPAGSHEPRMRPGAKSIAPSPQSETRTEQRRRRFPRPARIREIRYVPEGEAATSPAARGRSTMIRRAAVLVAAFVLVLGQVGSTLAASPPGAASPMDHALKKALDAGPTRFVVEVAARPDLRPAAKIHDHGKRAGFVADRLKATAKASQAEAIAIARATKGTHAASYWLGNSLFVNGDAKLAARLAKLKGVSSVHLPKVYPLVKPVEASVAILAAAGGPEWGVEKINADDVWNEGITGSGIVVGSVDTGVDFTHPALVNNYRGNNHDG